MCKSGCCSILCPNPNRKLLLVSKNQFSNFWLVPTLKYLTLVQVESKQLTQISKQRHSLTHLLVLRFAYHSELMYSSSSTLRMWHCDNVAIMKFLWHLWTDIFFFFKLLQLYNNFIKETRTFPKREGRDDWRVYIYFPNPSIYLFTQPRVYIYLPNLYLFTRAYIYLSNPSTQGLFLSGVLPVWIKSSF